jgi:hypothetical protein
MKRGWGEVGGRGPESRFDDRAHHGLMMVLDFSTKMMACVIFRPYKLCWTTGTRAVDRCE